MINGHGLLMALVWVIVAGVIFWVCNWLITYVGVPEPFNKVARVILAIAVVVILVNALLSLAGHPLIAW